GACANISVGRETEDFVITIAPGIQCSGTPSATGNVSATNLSVCNGGSTTLDLTNYPTELGLSFQWESSPAGQNNFTPIAGATGYSYSATGLSADIEYRMAVTCNNPGGGTASSPSVTVVV